MNIFKRPVCVTSTAHLTISFGTIIQYRYFLEERFENREKLSFGVRNQRFSYSLSFFFP